MMHVIGVIASAVAATAALPPSTPFPLASSFGLIYRRLRLFAYSIPRCHPYVGKRSSMTEREIALFLTVYSVSHFCIDHHIFSLPRDCCVIVSCDTQYLSHFYQISY